MPIDAMKTDLAPPPLPALDDLPMEQASAAGLVARTAAIGREIGLPSSLAEIGLDRSALPRVVELTRASGRLLAIAPVEVTDELLTTVLERAHAGDLTERSPA